MYKLIVNYMFQSHDQDILLLCWAYFPKMSLGLIKANVPYFRYCSLEVVPNNNICTISPLNKRTITSDNLNIWDIEVIDSSEVEDTTGGIQFVMPVKHPYSLWNLKKKNV